MSKVNLAITGCMGRMGQQLIKSSKINNVDHTVILIFLYKLYPNKSVNINDLMHKLEGAGTGAISIYIGSDISFFRDTTE